MEVTKDFIEAVDNGKKTRVRIMLKDSMLVDPSLKTFNAMLAYAEMNMSDLYDQHDGEEFKNDSSSWDEDYMNKQMISIVINFSKERIEILNKIVKKLYTHKIQAKKKITTTNGNTSSAKPSHSNGLTGVQIAGGVISVAGAGALIGGVVGSSLSLAIIGGVALTGGIVMVAFGVDKEA